MLPQTNYETILFKKFLTIDGQVMNKTPVDFIIKTMVRTEMLCLRKNSIL